MSPPPPPPPPAPSCPQGGTVWDGDIPESAFKAAAATGAKMWYNQDYAHSSGGSHICGYPTEYIHMNALKNDDSVNNSEYESMINRVCANEVNIAKSIPPLGTICAEHAAGIAIATDYCGEGDNIITQTDVCNNGDPLGNLGYQQLLNAYCTANNVHIKDSNHACSGLKTSASALYNTISAAYCEANPNDSFCSCYNVVNDKCADDSTTGVAGCNHPSGQAYVNNRNATPSDQKSLWDGQRKCGSVCTGAGKYIPDNNQAGCKTTIQICSQNFNVDNMSNSDISASCELNASDGPSVGAPPTSSQLSAQEEIDEAKAAVARGDPGAQERLDAAEAALDAANEAAGETGPKAYIPKSLDGLKNDRKQQIGAGAMGALVLGCMMMLLLLVASAGGGGPVKKRFR